MSDAMTIESAPPQPAAAHPLRPLVAGVLAFWFVLVMVLGATGQFVTPDGLPPWRLGLGVAVPVALFLLAFRRSDAFRGFMLALDARFVVCMQAWRFAGLGFIALYAHGVLPGVFAWPAGLGDIAVGASAPWILLALDRRPGYAHSRAFASWNVLGLLDLVVAVGCGAILSPILSAGAEAVSTRAMTQLPLILIPAFLVPIFAALHLTMLFRVRRRAGA